MKHLIPTLLIVATTLATTGCANMTPEQNARVGAAIGAGLMGAAAVADAYAQSRRPVYVAPQPVYVAPVYIAPRPNCWQSAVTYAWVCR